MLSSLYRNAASWVAASLLLASTPVASSILGGQSIITTFDEKCAEQNLTMWAADGRNFVMRRGNVALHWPKEHNATTWILEKAESQYPSSWYIAGLLPDGNKAYWYTGGNDQIQLQQSYYSKTAFTIKVADTNSSRPRVAIWTASTGTASYLNYDPEDGRVFVSYSTEPDNVLFEPVLKPIWNSTEDVCSGFITAPPKDDVSANYFTGDPGQRGCHVWHDCKHCGFYERCCLKWSPKARDEEDGVCACGTSGRAPLCW